MEKKMKTFVSDVLELSIFRLLFETIPTLMFFGLIWYLFHKSGLVIESSDNTEASIHFTVELLVALCYHVITEIKMTKNGYLGSPREDVMGQVANYFSMLIHILVILTIAAAFIGSCKTWL